MRINKKGWRLLLSVCLLCCVLCSNLLAVNAQTTSYMKKLNLKNSIKMNGTSTFTTTGVVGPYDKNNGQDVFASDKEVRVKITIKTKKKSVGDNYKVTFKVNYKYLDDPQIDNEVPYEDYGWFIKSPWEAYTVFNNKTGKTLEIDNDLGVQIESSKWKYTWYDEQVWTNSAGETSWRNQKSCSYSFSVTYPKNCKDVVVGVGFANCYLLDVDTSGYDYGNAQNDAQFWEGKATWKKSSYYKYGKDSFYYVKL